jgi:hypothetical protein
MAMPLQPRTEALFIGADWAIAHGDAGGLAQVASVLAQRCSGAMRRELQDLAHLCSVDYATAANRWPELSARARDSLARDVRPVL